MLGKTTFQSSDGKTLPFTSWRPESGEKPRAVVIAVHGLSGATSDFWPLGEHLAPRGIAVYGHELRGQGKDPEEKHRGDIGNRRQWFSDLITFVTEVKALHPDAPLFLQGESLGALIVMHGLSEFPEDLEIAGVIFSSPVVGIRHKVGCFTKFALHSAALVVPRKRLSLEELAGKEGEAFNVTAGTTHAGQMSVTDHYVKDFTLRLFKNIGTMVDRSENAARRLMVPTLVLYTPNDVLVSREQVEAFFDQVAATDKSKLFYPESYHLILHDVDRENALKGITEWLEYHLSN